MNTDELRKAFFDSLKKQTTGKSTEASAEVENNNCGLYFSYKQDCFYRGEEANGLPHGKGVCINSRGDVYCGEWKNGIVEGTGIATYTNGDCYRGEWSNGVANGKGFLNDVDGNFFWGKWTNGIRTTIERYLDKEGTYQHGEFNNIESLAKGMEAFEDGCQYGSFREGQLIKGIRIFYEDDKTETPAGCECGEFTPNEGLLKGTRSFLEEGYCSCGEYNSAGELLKGTHAWDDGNYEIEEGYC